MVNVLNEDKLRETLLKHDKEGRGSETRELIKNIIDYTEKYFKNLKEFDTNYFTEKATKEMEEMDISNPKSTEQILEDITMSMKCSFPSMLLTLIEANNCTLDELDEIYKEAKKVIANNKK
jgi:hypothetical protein